MWLACPSTVGADRSSDADSRVPVEVVEATRRVVLLVVGVNREVEMVLGGHDGKCVALAEHKLLVAGKGDGRRVGDEAPERDRAVTQGSALAAPIEEVAVASGGRRGRVDGVHDRGL